MNKHTATLIFIGVAFVAGVIGFFVGDFVQNFSSPQSSQTQNLIIDNNSEALKNLPDASYQQSQQGVTHPDCGVGVPASALFISEINSCVFSPVQGLTWNRSSQNPQLQWQPESLRYEADNPERSLASSGYSLPIPPGITPRAYLEEISLISQSLSNQEAINCQAANPGFNLEDCYQGIFQVSALNYSEIVLSLDQQIIAPGIVDESIVSGNGYDLSFTFGSPTIVSNDGIDFLRFRKFTIGDFGMQEYFVANINDFLVTVQFHVDSVDADDQAVNTDVLNRFDQIEFYIQ